MRGWYSGNRLSGPSCQESFSEALRNKEKAIISCDRQEEEFTKKRSDSHFYNDSFHDKKRSELSKAHWLRLLQ